MTNSSVSRYMKLALIGTLSGLCAACGPDAPLQTDGADAVIRQSLYRDLSLLEQNLMPVRAQDDITRNEQTLLDLVRSPSLLSPAENEIARSRRNLAFERLAYQSAPSARTNDYSAFWEIHQAYRHAVETGRFGHGNIGLVYSRPYPGDHLSGPLTELVAITGSVKPEAMPVQPKAGEADRLRSAISILAYRMELDSAAGLAPPPSVLDRMLAQIDGSPFASDIVLETFRAQLLAARAEAEPDGSSLFNGSLIDFLTPELMQAVQELRKTLLDIRASWESYAPPDTFSTAFYAALLAQATSSDMTADSCALNARRLSEDVSASLDLYLTAAIREFLPEGAPGNASLSERFALWQSLAPLFTPQPEAPVTDAPVAAKPLSDLPPETPVYHTDAFLVLDDALTKLRTEWQILFSRTLDNPKLTETHTPPPPPRYGYRPPAPVASALSSVPLRTHRIEERIELSSAEAQRLPPSLALIDLLSRHQPGLDALSDLKAKREDIPEMARSLPNAAFDLGWPYFVLEEMSERGTFVLAPRLEFARQYRLYQMLLEAELETALAGGRLSREEAAEILRSALNIPATNVVDIVDRLAVEPGLSCAALSGFSRLSALKTRAQGVLGGRFNIREFNDILLEQGSRPLDLVENDVDTWISSKLAPFDPNAPET